MTVKATPLERVAGALLPNDTLTISDKAGNLWDLTLGTLALRCGPPTDPHFTKTTGLTGTNLGILTIAWEATDIGLLKPSNPAYTLDLIQTIAGLPRIARTTLVLL